MQCRDMHNNYKTSCISPEPRAIVDTGSTEMFAMSVGLVVLFFSGSETDKHKVILAEANQSCS
jgi:hypothetical protein